MKIKSDWKLNGAVDTNEYDSMYQKSITNNDDFWNDQGNL